MRFDGATGADVWRSDISGSGSGSTGSNVATAVAIDAAGDVFVAGSVENSTTDVVVLKLAGATGAELWRRTIAGDRLVDSSIFATQSVLALTSTGDAVVAGRLPTGSGSVWFESTTAVTRVDGATGVGVWQTMIGDVGAPPSNDQPGDLELDASDDVYVTSKLMLTVPTPPTSLAVRALSGVDGSERWRMDLPGQASASHAETFVAGTASALDPSGNLVAGGCVVKRQSGEPETESTVLTLVAANGADRVAGTTLAVADRPGQPAARAVKLLAKTGVGLSVSLDADPVLLGGALELRNPGTGETATFALPAAGWTARIGSKGLDYFVYRDSARQYGPCTNVLIKTGSLKATCKGAQIGFTLDEPSQGALAARLTTGNGAGARRYCMLFGGTVSQDQPNVFKARAAAAPAACPFP
ncbi:MAG TPA: hypothetical protein VGR62_01070 [Candidatus Binatia bacterium]|jgi:hypothetical protein|nr:hypothetical protein [Candidatus Binatia bacterium]